ncbi:MAG TPA: hypothetical protein ENG10_02270 [Candidatus Bathyarchaeota archaeon]|nr:hypothetical protein [Candidatus Bathyarchaeota archaeon]HEX69104.1 hypothetical protein [Candidatus Bathyarchaeota archaeon]
MSRARIIKDEIVEENVKFLAIFIETKNSCIFMLSQNEDRLGTLVAAIPPGKGLIGPSTSSVLLGGKNATIARIIAEKMASKTSKVSLVSVYLETLDESVAGPILVRLVEKVMGKRAEESEAGVESGKVKGEEVKT